MSNAEILLLALALSMDAFAVSIACGITACKRLPLGNALAVSVSFGIFQMLMPILGYICARLAYEFIEAFDHWIAFALLEFIGLNMIREALFAEDERDCANFICPLKWGTLFALSIATSIDALAAGISLACTATSILYPSVVIGLVTFAVSLSGIKFGAKIGGKFGSKVEIVGGGVLMFIGLKIIVSELLA